MNVLGLRLLGRDDDYVIVLHRVHNYYSVAGSTSVYFTLLV